MWPKQQTAISGTTEGRNTKRKDRSRSDGI